VHSVCGLFCGLFIFGNMKTNTAILNHMDTPPAHCNPVIVWCYYDHEMTPSHGFYCHDIGKWNVDGVNQDEIHCAWQELGHNPDPDEMLDFAGYEPGDDRILKAQKYCPEEPLLDNHFGNISAHLNDICAYAERRTTL
jgi:hypothetical protein